MFYHFILTIPNRYNKMMKYLSIVECKQIMLLTLFKSNNLYNIKKAHFLAQKTCNIYGNIII